MNPEELSRARAPHDCPLRGVPIQELKPQPYETHWHLRKELSISTLIAVVTVAFGGIWGFADLSHRLDSLEEAVGKLESSPITESRLTVVEGKVENVRDQLNLLRDQNKSAQETQKQMLQSLARIEAELKPGRIKGE